MTGRRLLALSLVLSAATLATRSDAQCVNGARGEAIRDCRLHIVTGPVFAPSRVLGLAGAYQGIAEGLPGFAVSAAAPAVRTPWSWSWFDYDIDASISIPTPFRRIDDLEYDGVSEGFDYSGFIFVTLGGNLQFGPWGVGVINDLTRFDLTPDRGEGEESYSGFLSKTKLLVARSLLDGDLVIGGGLRHIAFDVGGRTPEGERKSLVSAQGVAPELGFLYRPDEASFRVGATYRMAVTTGDPNPTDASRVDRWSIPKSVDLPWELDIGAAFQVGPWPLNIHWPNPRDARAEFGREIRHARRRRATDRAVALAASPPERRAEREKQLEEDERALRAREDLELGRFNDRFERRAKEQFGRMPREHVMFTLGMLVTGATASGISLESFFTQQVRRAGAVVTFSPRAGIESEIIPGLLRPRIGTYIEPSRFTTEPDWRAFRQHVTAGFDLNLFRWRVFGLYEQGTSWRVTMAVDVTRGYWNYGVSVGIWR